MVPLSTVDYPDRLAAVIFCQGCPWRCDYCHNPHLLAPVGDAFIAWDDIIAFLERRQGLLDAVVFTGGEPTRQAGIEQAIIEVKEMGYQVALHTAGCYPERLERLLRWVDWLAMDIKAPFDRYEAVTGIPGSGAKAVASITSILRSGIAAEFHTTVGDALLQEDWLVDLASALAGLGVTRYVLQECRTESLIPRPVPAALVDRIAPLFDKLTIRKAA